MPATAATLICALGETSDVGDCADIRLSGVIPSEMTDKRRQRQRPERQLVWFDIRLLLLLAQYWALWECLDGLGVIVCARFGARLWAVNLRLSAFKGKEKDTGSGNDGGR